MKKFIILISLCFFCKYSFSQIADNPETNTGSKSAKEQKLAERKAKAEATARIVDGLIQSRRFVVEAKYISDQTGRRVVVNSQVNFIRIDSAQISIQIAPQTGGSGANGLGGITAEGSVTNWEMKRFGKNQQTYSVKLYARILRAGSYEVLLIIGEDGSVQATLSGIDASKIIFYGKLFSIQESKIYKGSSI